MSNVISNAYLASDAREREFHGATPEDARGVPFAISTFEAIVEVVVALRSAFVSIHTGAASAQKAR